MKKNEETTIRIGRGTFNDIVIDDESVLVEHCNIVMDNKGCRVVNLHKESKTFVNNEEVYWEADITPNDELRVGNKVVDWSKKYLTVNKGKEEGATKVCQEALSEKKRNGFVTFWIRLSIITNLIVIPWGFTVYIKLYNSFKYELMMPPLNKLNTEHLLEIVDHYVHISIIVLMIGCIVAVVFLSKILHWKKSGFWGLACTSIIINIISVINEKAFVSAGLSYGITLFHGTIPTMVLFAPPLSIFILWAVLQIRKNGVSCWRHLK